MFLIISNKFMRAGIQHSAHSRLIDELPFSRYMFNLEEEKKNKFS